MSEGQALVTDETAVDEGLGDTSNLGEPSTAFDPTPFNSHLVTLKVDGKDVQMTLSEALAGSMRQADYTQKSQANAEAVTFASSLRAALTADPKGTLSALAEKLGVKMNAIVENDDYVDPTEKELAAIKSELKALTEHNQHAQVKAEIASLKQRYDDFNEDELLPFAVSRGVSLEDAYRIKAFDKLLKVKASTDVAAEAAEAVETATKAKKQAQVVSPGHSPKPGAETGGEIVSMMDAFKAAKKTLGLG